MQAIEAAMGFCQKFSDFAEPDSVVWQYHAQGTRDALSQLEQTASGCKAGYQRAATVMIEQVILKALTFTQDEKDNLCAAMEKKLVGGKHGLASEMIHPLC